MSKDDYMHRFDMAGPQHRQFNWDIPQDRGSILACLVAGVYALEYDRLKKYKDERCLAPPWWTNFNYVLVDHIIGKGKLRINGAVFKWDETKLQKPRTAPGVVLAFRGTSNIISDYVVDYKIVNQELHKTARFTAAYNAVRNAVQWHGRENVCVTGHSLGAALALSAAQQLALEDQFIEAHLFNPPFSSSMAPFKHIIGTGAYNELQELYTVAKAELVNWLVDPEKRREAELRFLSLSGWHPDLYVHKKDPICSGFLDHFTNYSYLLAGKHGKLVMPHQSIRGVLFSAKSKPHHLIPSARLHTPATNDPHTTFRQAHSLEQWWKDSLPVETRFVNLTGQEHIQLQSGFLR